MNMRIARSKAAIGLESLEGRQLQSVLNPQPLPPGAHAEVRAALNPQPLPPIGHTEVRAALNPQPLPPGAHAEVLTAVDLPRIHPVR